MVYPDGIPRRFYGDAGKIRQVMMNLVGNAVRFTSSGQVLVAVECEPWGANHAQVRVSVTEVTIPPETIGSLFERSSQGTPLASKVRGGAGIGLVVSKKVIELMGGRLHVESQVGKGSKVWFQLLLTVEGASQ